MYFTRHRSVSARLARMLPAWLPISSPRSHRPWRHRTPHIRSLRTRMALSIVAIVLVLAAVMGVFSTLTLRHTLMEHLDEQLLAANNRSEVRRHVTEHGTEHEHKETGQTEQGPGTQETSLPSFDSKNPSLDSDYSSQTTPQPHAPLPPGLDAAGQAAGTLTLIAPGNSSTQGDDIKGAYIDDSGTYQTLTDSQKETLLNLAASDHPVTVDLPNLGDYRVLVSHDPTSHDTVITGLSMTGENALIRTQLLAESVIALVGAAIAALVGRAATRSSLAPLERVAATARRVASQPLAHGDVSIDERVQDDDLASSEEVGQVGTALNLLLGHVDDALTARQRSETQVRQFVADASHELRTPLASIRGYTELIQREHRDASDHDLSSEARYALGRVHSESLRMTGLVEDLLLLARLDAGRELRREEVDLLAIALDAVADAQAAGPDHTWDLDLSALTQAEEEDLEIEADDIPLVTGDEARLRQVLVNLLANARVHTPAGTRVTTRLWHEYATPTITAPASKAKGQRPLPPGTTASAETQTGVWKISVCDNGPGIDPTVRDRVFERFARGDASRERRSGSTGLGMSIALAIVRSHGGSIRVDSVSVQEDPHHHGTSVTVTLPARSPQSL